MTWTAPATPVALTAITVAFYNTNIRDNLNHLRGMLPDPGAANRMPISSSATAAAWGPLTLAVIPDGLLTAAKFAAGAAVGNIANATLTAAMLAAGAAASNVGAGGVSAAMLAAGAAASNIGAGGVTASMIAALTGNLKLNNLVALQLGEVTTNFMRSVLLMDTANVVNFGVATNAMALLGPPGTDLTYNGSKVYTAANDGASSGLDADLFRGVNALARANHTGTQLAASISDLATAVALLDAATVGTRSAAFLLARANHTGTQLAATISDLATAVSGMAAASATTATSATSATTAATATNALALGGAAAANYARKDVASDFTTRPTINGGDVAIAANNTYNGNGAGARVIVNTLGYEPRAVLITGTGVQDVGAIILRNDLTLLFMVGTGAMALSSGGSLDASGFTVPSSLNTSGNTYTWTVLG